MRFLTSQYHLAVVSLLAFRRSVVFVKELVPGHCVTLAVRDIYEEPFASPLSAKPHSARLPGRCLLRKNFLQFIRSCKPEPKNIRSSEWPGGLPI